jgi:hypothetical protein
MEQCHSLLRECLQILEASNDKDVHAFVGDQPDIPSDQMKLSFSQFKSIVLNQGLIIREGFIIDRKSKINKTSPHLMPLRGLSSQAPGSNHDRAPKQQAKSVFMAKEDFR